MKHLYLSAMLSLSGLVAYPATSTLKTIEVDGMERKAIVYLPDGYAQQKLPLLLFLHPNGFSASDFAEKLHLSSVCDDVKSIVVVPEALDEQNKEITNLLNMAEAAGLEMPGFSLTYVWNAGARVESSEFTSQIPPQQAALLPFLFPDIARSGYIRFNKDVDDVKFINQLLDSVEEEYSVDADKLYVLGASMGGAMTYKYALSDNTKAKGIAVFCGFLGGDVEFDGNFGMPLLVVHSQDDEVVNFKGGLLDIPVSERVAGFVKANGCGEATQSIVGDIADDGISIVKYDYACDSEKRVRFFELKGASHATFLQSDYVTGPNDMDYVWESYKFFFGEQTGVKDAVANTLALYPNPAKNEVQLSVKGDYTITTLDGKQVSRGKADGTAIATYDLATGIYFITVENAEGRYVSKLIKE